MNGLWRGLPALATSALQKRPERSRLLDCEGTWRGTWKTWLYVFFKDPTVRRMMILRVTVIGIRVLDASKSQGLMSTSMLTRSARTQDLQLNHKTIGLIQTTTFVPLSISSIGFLIDLLTTLASTTLKKILR